MPNRRNTKLITELISDKSTKQGGMTETYGNGNVSTMQACVLTGHSLDNARNSYIDPKNLLNVIYAQQVIHRLHQ